MWYSWLFYPLLIFNNTTGIIVAVIWLYQTDFFQSVIHLIHNIEKDVTTSHTHTNTQTHMCLYKHIYTYTYTYIPNTYIHAQYIYIYTYLNVCVYTYIHLHTQDIGSFFSNSRYFQIRIVCKQQIFKKEDLTGGFLIEWRGNKGAFKLLDYPSWNGNIDVIHIQQ